MYRRLFMIIPATAAAVLVPIGMAAADGGHSPRSRSAAPAAPGQAPFATGAMSIPHVGEPSPAGWGSTYQPPVPGSGIDTTKLIPGLDATYGAATGGLFPSPPTDPASGYVARSAISQPPAVGEIDLFLASDGHQYYRVVNRSANGVTYSH